MKKLTFIIMFSLFRFIDINAQFIYVNGIKYELSEIETTIVEFKIGDKVGVVTSSLIEDIGGEIKIKLKASSYFKKRGYALIYCDEQSKNDSSKVRGTMRLTSKIPEGRQEEYHTSERIDSGCNASYFIIDTSNLECVNRITLYIIAKQRDQESRNFKIELRPDKLCN